MRIRTAWLLVSLSSALCLPAGIAIAQDGTVVPKIARRPPAPSPRRTNKAYDAAEPAPGEINQGAGDEGAGWDAAVEAAPGATPLIGEQQDAAVQRINDYFNNLNSIQGNFEQIDSNNKRTSGRFYVQRPGKLRFDYAPPSTLRLVADGHFLAIEDFEPEDRREISASSRRRSACCSARASILPATRASSASRATTARSPSRSRTRAARRPARSSSISTPRRR